MVETRLHLCRCMVTLKVYSCLEAVGITVPFSTAMAKNGISCNEVPDFHHDHIFVPAKHADKAMKILNNLETLLDLSAGPTLNHIFCNLYRWLDPIF